MRICLMYCLECKKGEASSVDLPEPDISCECGAARDGFIIELMEARA